MLADPTRFPCASVAMGSKVQLGLKKKSEEAPVTVSTSVIVLPPGNPLVGKSSVDTKIFPGALGSIAALSRRPPRPEASKLDSNPLNAP